MAATWPLYCWLFVSHCLKGAFPLPNETPTTFRYSLTNSTGVQKPEDAEKQWLYVKNAHSDWGMPDITALNSAVAVNDAQAARNEARVILQAPVESSSNKEAPANNASQDVSQPKEPSNNNNNP